MAQTIIFVFLLCLASRSSGFFNRVRHVNDAILRSNFLTFSNANRPKLYEAQEWETLNSFDDSNATYFGVSCALSEQCIVLGRFKEAKQFALDAIDVGDHMGANNTIYSAYAEGILGDALYAEGSFKESSQRYRSALHMYENQFHSTTGPRSVELSGATQLMVWAMISDNHLGEVRSAWSKALNESEILLGPNAEVIAGSLATLARAYVAKKDEGRNAEILFKSAIKAYESTLNSSHHTDIDRPLAMRELCRAYADLGDLYLAHDRDVAAQNCFAWVQRTGSKGVSLEPSTALQVQRGLMLVGEHHDEAVEAEWEMARALFNLERMTEQADHSHGHGSSVAEVGGGVGGGDGGTSEQLHDMFRVLQSLGDVVRTRGGVGHSSTKQT